MRFALIFVLGMLLLSNDLVGQFFKGGIMVGGSASQIDGDHVSGYDKSGITLGTYVNYSFSQRISIQPEFHYRRIGSRLTERKIVRKGGELTDIRVDVLDLPIAFMIHYPLNLGELEVQTDWFLGPVLGVQLDWMDKFGDQRIINTARRYDFRMMAGMAFHIIDEISIDLRISNSFSPFLNVAVIDTSTVRQDKEFFIWYHNYISATLKLQLWAGSGKR